MIYNYFSYNGKAAGQIGIPSISDGAKRGRVWLTTWTPPTTTDRGILAFSKASNLQSAYNELTTTTEQTDYLKDALVSLWARTPASNGSQLGHEVATVEYVHAALAGNVTPPGMTEENYITESVFNTVMSKVFNNSNNYIGAPLESRISTLETQYSEYSSSINQLTLTVQQHDNSINDLITSINNIKQEWEEYQNNPFAEPLILKAGGASWPTGV